MNDYENNEIDEGALVASLAFLVAWLIIGAAVGGLLWMAAP